MFEIEDETCESNELKILLDENVQCSCPVSLLLYNIDNAMQYWL